MTELADWIIGTSLAARALDAEITAAAASDAKVLITGETGVGKEMTARLLHYRSPRQSQPVIAINCAGVPDSLLESELFGHVRGSFTDAVRDKAGIFEAANGGTVFLDEVGEMSPRMQALLLRFLESGEVQRVGAERPTPRLDVRVVCATNRSLPDRIAEGAFREDLFYRLNVVHIHVPALRDRQEDLPRLIAHFAQWFASRHRVPVPQLDPAVEARLIEYPWPGNVRELKNVLERLVVRARDTRVAIDDLPPEVRYAGVRIAGPAPGASPVAQLADVVARELYHRMLVGGASFWAVVHAPFLAHDLTRDTVRRVVALGLEETGGSYDGLPALFNLGAGEQRRFTAFLRKYECHAEGVGSIRVAS